MDLTAELAPILTRMLRFLFPPWTLAELAVYVAVGCCIAIAVALYERRILGQGRWTSEGLFFSLFLARRISRLANARNHFSVFAALVGFLFAGLERFCIGFVFHSISSYTIPHENYHDRLRRRKLFLERNNSDDFHEIVSYVILFWFFYFVVSRSDGFWMGVAIEHFSGHLLRVFIQYVPTASILDHHAAARGVSKIWWRFLANADAYFWHHILVDPLACSGFSACAWDRLAGRCPAWAPLPQPRALAVLSVVPFADFFLWPVVAETNADITKGWDGYRKDPQGFMRNMWALHEKQKAA
jgi:hypothetical protein